MSNTFGNILKLTTFGESHGLAIGGVLDGCPAGIPMDIKQIQRDLDRRKPGQSKLVTQRKESDQVEILSGIFDGMTTGTPIGFTIKNEDQKSKDYSHLKDNFRPSHADFVYEKKYGHRDYRGGGRSSARETACRVVGGAIAKQILAKYQVKIEAYVSAVGEIKTPADYSIYNIANAENNLVRCPDDIIANKMIDLIAKTKKNGDSIGGIVTCVIKGSPIGLGEPIYNKLSASLAGAMFGINAVKGFELGSGFAGCMRNGSAENDIFDIEEEEVFTKTNHSGGIQGGISNGQDIYFNVGFKPVATILQQQDSVNKLGEKVVLDGKGRHDPCVVPRAVPIVEAMAALVLLDHFLLAKTNHIQKSY
ncbi:chorismate synthase [Putridiphycobacter roseus]|uniref:Chorismate synthase n=1 Tax=Putridiphycobacter roseus TaxID=2219161 RepID=A0A2W1N120_9FLAO|nr:chorismate synthase [Putridiphycobacter roseus]PZE17474.1 chorismate synthase [Putridiphycobacter roseus]